MDRLLSEYMRNRRKQIVEKLLDQTERSLDLTEREIGKRQALTQGVDASMRAYTNRFGFGGARGAERGFVDVGADAHYGGGCGGAGSGGLAWPDSGVINRQRR